MPNPITNQSRAGGPASSPGDAPGDGGSPCALARRPPSARPAPSREGHPEAHARIRRAPEYGTGLEISRADLSEAGACPPTGPWSPCSGAAGLTEAYLGHLARAEPGADPAAEAELAYVVEQFALSHALGRCRYAAFPHPVPSPYPGHPYVGAYVDAALSHGEADGPGGGLLLVAAPSDAGGFLARYRSLNRAEAHWWASGDGPAALLAPGLLRPHLRRAVSGLIDRAPAFRT